VRSTLCTVACLIALSVALPAAAEDLATPTDTQLKLYEEGALAFGAGEYEKAARLFQASIDLGPLNVTYLNLGRALFRLDRCEEARDALDAARSAPRVADPPHEAVMDKIVEYSLDLADCGSDPVVVVPDKPVEPEPVAARPEEPKPEEPKPVARKPRKKPFVPGEAPRFFLEAKLGLVLGGNGKFKSECTGECDGVDLEEEETSDKSAVGVGVDGFLRVAPKFYVGAGLIYVPDTELESDIEGLDTFGSDLTLHVGGAYRTPLSSRLTLDLRGHLGLLLLFPGGDLEDGIDAQTEACANEDCDVAQGPFGGISIGLGAGGSFDLGAISLNAGLGLQYINVAVSTLRIAETTLDSRYAGARWWIWLGAAL
jgi:hypothetical protein